MKYLILGAGPAGLTVANWLLQQGETSFAVLEKEEEAGGLCRSKEVDGAPLDTGGGHFLDVRRPQVTDFLFAFMPRNEWNLFERDSRISINGRLIGHPIEANIWQMDTDDQNQYLKSIEMAGCNQGLPMPEAFVDWIYWKLGSRIAEDYMIPYNQKVFSDDLNELGTYWLEKLPDVKYEETLLSCREKKAYGREPGHASFYYPKEYGYGEVWKRMADAVSGHIHYGVKADILDFERHTVNDTYNADCIINTVPWTSFSVFRGMPEELISHVRMLKYSSVQIEYFPEKIDSDAQWIYYPDAALSFHRILLRHNFCPNARGYWTETNSKRTTKPSNGTDCFMNEYAYPLNTIRKPAYMKRLLEWTKSKNVIGLGRWGEWQHYNSDVVVEKAITLAQEVMKKWS